MQGTENVVTICSEKELKIIFTSSVAVYGFAEPGTNESGNINPFNEYGQTKFYAEEKLRQWYSDGNNSLMIVRPTVIFGKEIVGTFLIFLIKFLQENFYDWIW